MRIASGIKAEDVKLGKGAFAKRGRLATIRWKCSLNHGDEVNAGTMSFRIGDRQVIAGLNRGVVGMLVGGIRKLRISPHLGYRDRPVDGIPANAVLLFQVELLALSD